MNRRLTSYTYKHYVEGWSRNGTSYRYLEGTNMQRSDFQYVSNGAFILAAAELGYLIERSAPGSLNAYFNIEMLSDRQRHAEPGTLVVV